MSRTVQIFGLKTSEPLKYTPEKQAELRSTYGVPEEFDATKLLKLLKRLDKIETKYFDVQNALDGMDIAFSAMDIMRGRKEPIYVPANAGLTIPKPFMFLPDGSTTAAFRYVFENFAVNAGGFQVQGNLEGEYAHFSEKNGAHAMMRATSEPVELEDLAMPIQRNDFQAFYLIGRHLLHSSTSVEPSEVSPAV